MAYMTVNFKCGTKTHNFHAKQDEHNHTKSNEFSKAAKALMKKMYPQAADGDIEQGSYKSNQSSFSSPSNELVWRGSSWVQGKA